MELESVSLRTICFCVQSAAVLRRQTLSSWSSVRYRWWRNWICSMTPVNVRRRADRLGHVSGQTGGRTASTYDWTASLTTDANEHARVGSASRMNPLENRPLKPCTATIIDHRPQTPHLYAFCLSHPLRYILYLVIMFLLARWYYG